MTEPDSTRRFTAMYAAHHAQVYAYAVNRAGRDLAEDIVAETFLVAWRRLGEMPVPPLPWLLGVARNVSRERYRDEARQSALAAEKLAWAADAEADVADGVHDRVMMLAALTRLSEDDRELLTLVGWHGLSPRDAARVVGCSAAAYFVRLHRARKRLREALGDPGAAAPLTGRPLPTTFTSREYVR